ncbi:MAG: hypothetical protein GTO63_35050 [Anaerolineae bacterium]|nr:hypothetical protein [Anaerolineae bacterium]NIN99912.1 hypothetical protein [Anaerolineae bacterium]NIQ79349.1 hypothetical protein [Anaerolineae bacterium]
MAGDKELIERLEKWVGEHPEDADVPHIHLTTQKEFTIRGILEQLVEEEETGVAIVEDELLEIKGLIKDWMGG